MMRRAPAPAYSEKWREASGRRGSVQKTAEPESTTDGEDRRLLRSIVDFGDTLVREVDDAAPRHRRHPAMTATISDLRALFREQEYSRFPVFRTAWTTSSASCS